MAQAERLEADPVVGAAVGVVIHRLRELACGDQLPFEVWVTP
jgi:hypothetical protein